jgi:PIN domain nuclease of toxin-antitoxin system
VNLLLDTHVLLWWLTDSRKLGRRARAAIAGPRAMVWVSAATAWEIAIKTALGRLVFAEPPEVCLPRELERSHFNPLPVSVEHALAFGTLPRHHTDPFDRLLIAQAQRQGLTIVTADGILSRYDVRTLDATC